MVSSHHDGDDGDDDDTEGGGLGRMSHIMFDAKTHKQTELLHGLADDGECNYANRVES